MTIQTPTPRGRRVREDLDPVLEVSGLGVDFMVEGQWVTASKDVAFTIMPGEVMALVGESGSGKSVSSMGILGLLPRCARCAGTTSG
jgi:peptide/nickel transport system ATP-binding protein